MCLNSTGCGQRDQSAGACTCGGNGGEHGGFHLREATVADVPALVGLIGELAAFEGLHHECEVTGPLLAKHLFGTTAVARAIIAHHRGQPAGFAVWYPTFSTFLGQPGGFLEDLYVRPQFRKRGLGRELLSAAAREAQLTGCARFEWRALKWNDTALKFYKSLGAEVLAEWLTLRLDGPKLFALPTAVTAPAAIASANPSPNPPAA
jgi:GNAT superfamily N-acetyltransferase